MYDLKVDGVRDFRLYVSRPRVVVREPLSGYVGVDTTYRSRYRPWLRDPAPSIFIGSTEAGSDTYHVDLESGTVEFTTVPDQQPSASYHWSDVGDDEAIGVLISAFREMESRWPRGFRLFNGSGLDMFYDDGSSPLYVADWDGNDPACGRYSFSTSPVEREYLMSCAKYVVIANALQEAAQHSFAYRESDRGITVDKTNVPRNIESALKVLDGEVYRKMRVAQSVYYSSGQHLGRAMIQPATEDYLDNYAWQPTRRIR